MYTHTFIWVCLEYILEQTLGVSGEVKLPLTEETEPGRVGGVSALTGCGEWRATQTQNLSFTYFYAVTLVFSMKHEFWIQALLIQVAVAVMYCTVISAHHTHII